MSCDRVCVAVWAFRPARRAVGCAGRGCGPAGRRPRGFPTGPSKGQFCLTIMTNMKSYTSRSYTNPNTNHTRPDRPEPGERRGGGGGAAEARAEPTAERARAARAAEARTSARAKRPRRILYPTQNLFDGRPSETYGCRGGDQVGGRGGEALNTKPN